MKNLNLIFNKVYYSKINTVNFKDADSKNKEVAKAAAADLENDIEKHNKLICNVVFNHSTDFAGLGKDVAPHWFLMETVYPGLIIGSGNPHGAQLCDNDVNNGFSFDYVSGQPYIPGSTVKGVLRSCFKDYPDAVCEIVKEEFPHVSQSIKELEEEIFDGNDIFFDAVIYAGNRYGKILDTDNITPHPDETKSPKPILILKVLPEVRFMFEFRFSDGALKADEKRRLMIILLSVFGVGAKTNTGYGRLKHTEDEEIASPQSVNCNIENDNDTIVCRDCGKIHRLTDFEKDKIKNEGWKIVRCKNCNLKRKQQFGKR